MNKLTLGRGFVVTPQPPPPSNVTPTWGERLRASVVQTLRSQGPATYDQLFRRLTAQTGGGVDGTTLRRMLDDDTTFEIIGQLDTGRANYAPAWDVVGGDPARRKTFLVNFIPNEDRLQDDVWGWVKAFERERHEAQRSGLIYAQGFAAHEVAADLGEQERHVRHLLDRFVREGSLAHHIERGKQPLYTLPTSP